MKNYISVNMKYYKSTRINTISKHNEYRDNIDYILKKEDRYDSNKTIVYDFDNNETKKSLLEVFDESLTYKNEIMKKKGFHKKNGNELCEMVVSLSEEQSKHYLDNGVDIMTGYKAFMSNMMNKYGFKPLSIQLHLDEGFKDENGVVKHNIHSHCLFHNFDFMDEKTILRTLKKQDFRDFQDLAEKSFRDVGLDFKRGVEKKDSSLKHLERNDYILNKQHSQIKKNTKDIQNGIEATTTMDNFIMDLDDQIKNKTVEINDIDISIKTLKTLRSNITKNLDKSRDEKKVLYSEITKEQKTLRTLRKEIVSKKSDLSTFKKSINDDMNDILKYSKKTIGYNENRLKEAIIHGLSEYSKMDLKLKELSDIKEKNIELINVNNSLLSDIKQKDKIINNQDETINDYTKDFKLMKDRDKEVKSFTNQEVNKVSKSLLNDINNLKSELKEEKSKVKNLSKTIEELEKYKEFVITENLGDNMKDKNTHNIHI